MNNLELSKNPNTPPETLKVLSTDCDSWVFRGFAENPNSTEMIKKFVLMTDDKEMNSNAK